MSVKAVERTDVAVMPVRSMDAQAIEAVLLGGDLAKLTPDQRMAYYHRVCESLGLNPLTKPFAYISLNGKLVLYALKDATEQLRKLHGVSILDVSSTRLEDVFVVTAKAQDRTGRTDAATGAVAIGNLKGENLANALMKAETKAKRRVTLSICGLGMLDETEVESIAGAMPVVTIDADEIPAPDGYEDWLLTFSQAANQGLEALREHIKGSRRDHWNYLTLSDNVRYEAIKARAEAVSKKANEAKS